MTIFLSSLVFLVAGMLMLWASYLLRESIAKMQVSLKRTERKFRSDVKKLDGLTASVDSVVKILPLIAYHERVMAASVNSFVEAVNKSGATMAKDSFSSYDELDRYRISVENELIAQGQSPSEARINAVSHITNGMTIDSAEGLGIGA